MSNSIIPTQLGYTAPGSAKGSQIYLGKDLSVNFEAIGLGEGGRPDVLESLKINITLVSGSFGNQNTPTKRIASFNLNASDLRGLYTGNVNFPSDAEFRLREFSVCEVTGAAGQEVSEERRVALWACQSYSTGVGNENREY